MRLRTEDVCVEPVKTVRDLEEWSHGRHEKYVRLYSVSFIITTVASWFRIYGVSRIRLVCFDFIVTAPVCQREFVVWWCLGKKVKWPRYRPGVAQRVGRGIAVLFHDRGTRRGWVVSSTPRPHSTPRKHPVPILQEAGWAPGPVWTGGKSRPHRDSIADRPARSQSLYRLSYRAHWSLQV